MVRSGAGLGPGLLRVIGRTRPWPGLARGEAPGLPQHSALGPPNITNYRGARGDTSSAAEVESHGHRTPPLTTKRHRTGQFGCSAGCPGQGIAPGRHALPGQPSARRRPDRPMHRGRRGYMSAQGVSPGRCTVSCASKRDGSGQHVAPASSDKQILSRQRPPPRRHAMA